MKLDSDEFIGRAALRAEREAGSRRRLVGLEMRGAGEVLGTRQTGEASFKIADLLHDVRWFSEVDKLARLMQQADGYRYTIVSGEVTYEDGKATGALPGKLVRGATSSPTA